MPCEGILKASFVQSLQRFSQSPQIPIHGK